MANEGQGGTGRKRINKAYAGRTQSCKAIARKKGGRVRREKNGGDGAAGTSVEK